METILIYFIRICFFESTQSGTVLSPYSVSRYQVFSVNSTTYFKLLFWLSSKFCFSPCKFSGFFWFLAFSGLKHCSPLFFGQLFYHRAPFYIDYFRRAKVCL